MHISQIVCKEELGKNLFWQFSLHQLQSTTQSSVLHHRCYLLLYILLYIASHVREGIKMLSLDLSMIGFDIYLVLPSESNIWHRDLLAMKPQKLSKTSRLPKTPQRKWKGCKVVQMWFYNLQSKWHQLPSPLSSLGWAWKGWIVWAAKDQKEGDL